MLKTSTIDLSILILAGCQPKAPNDLPPPHDPNPPAPNCAADGSGCKQFNPDKL